MFDKVIDDRHGGYRPDQKHRTDLDHTKVSQIQHKEHVQGLNNL